jgi:hypothetical protein
MAYASKAGRARTSAKSPVAQAVCDRCSLWYSITALSWQFDWRGTALQNLWLRVCSRCLDTPQSQLRAIQLPADPVPVWQPRPENFLTDEVDSNQPIGIPTGLDINAVMPYDGVVQKAFGVPISVLSVISNGTTTIFVTCSQPHGLNNDDQIAIQGLSDRNACGFFSVTMFTPMAFTYVTGNPIAAASLLTPTTRMITCLVGLPRGSTQIPQINTLPPPQPPPPPPPPRPATLVTETGLDLQTETGQPLETDIP